MTRTAMTRIVRAGLALAALCAAAPASAQECQLTEVGTGQAARIDDGRTLTLADGRAVRLAGIEVPPAGSKAGAAARESLATLARGRVLTLKAGHAATDRYGRVVAFAFAGATMLQTEMIASGHAQVAGRVGDTGCLRLLRQAERAARDNTRGLWGSAGFRLQTADNPTDILQKAGQFGLVRGKVLSVRESGATIYVNFGRRWSTDFTVTILKRNRRLFVQAGMDPKALDGHAIEVRGYIERRGGPLIEATRPEQIEIVQ